MNPSPFATQLLNRIAFRCKLTEDGYQCLKLQYRWTCALSRHDHNMLKHQLTTDRFKASKATSSTEWNSMQEFVRTQSLTAVLLTWEPRIHARLPASAWSMFLPLHGRVQWQAKNLLTICGCNSSWPWRFLIPSFVSFQPHISNPFFLYSLASTEDQQLFRDTLFPGFLPVQHLTYRNCPRYYLRPVERFFFPLRIEAYVWRLTCCPAPATSFQSELKFSPRRTCRANR